MFNYVYLDTRHNDFLVDPDTYEQIASLVRAGKLCTLDFQDRTPIRWIILALGKASV